MKLLLAAALTMAVVYGAYQAIGAATDEPPVDYVLVLDGSASFAEQVDTCPDELKTVAEQAVRSFDRLRIASFARDALGRPWLHDADYRQRYDDAREREEVEVATRDEWLDKQVAAAKATLRLAAEESTQFGSVLLQQLERIALAEQGRGDRELQIDICSDGEIVDEGVDVREEFDQQAALELWLPRLRAGLDGARVRVVGFGRDMKPEPIRRAREFFTTLMVQAGADEPEFEAGSKR